VHAGKHLDQRRLARAVVAEERNDLAREQVDIDVLERMEAAEGLGNAAEFDQGRAHLRLPW
jgi:hypothetical protein